MQDNTDDHDAEHLTWIRDCARNYCATIPQWHRIIWRNVAQLSYPSYKE